MFAKYKTSLLDPNLTIKQNNIFPTARHPPQKSGNIVFKIYYVFDPQLVLSPIIFYVTDTTFVPKTELDHSEKFLQKQLKQLEKIISFGGIIFTHRDVQSDGAIQISSPSSLFILLPDKTISNC